MWDTEWQKNELDYKENFLWTMTSNSLTWNEEHHIPWSQILKTVLVLSFFFRFFFRLQYVCLKEVTTIWSVVCAATAAQHEWGQPPRGHLWRRRLAGPTSAVLLWQHQPLQNRPYEWSIYILPRKRSNPYTAKNAATVNRRAETSQAGNAILWWKRP